MRNIEPERVAGLLGLAGSVWRLEAERLAEACADAEPEAAPALLREVANLLAFAPDALAPLLAGMAGPRRLDTLLRAGATESAALALLPGQSAWMLSRGGEGFYLATVVLESDSANQEASAPGECAGLALAGALLSAAMAGLPEDFGAAGPLWLN